MYPPHVSSQIAQVYFWWHLRQVAVDAGLAKYFFGGTVTLHVPLHSVSQKNVSLTPPGMTSSTHAFILAQSWHERLSMSPMSLSVSLNHSLHPALTGQPPQASSLIVLKKVRDAQSVSHHWGWCLSSSIHALEG